MQPASTIIDRIAYTASLATNPADIDQLLDPLRDVTSRVDVSKPLDSGDQARLEALQKQIETYLVTNEKLRSFTPDSLRLQIEGHMRGRTDRRGLIALFVVLVVSFGVATAAATLLDLDSIQQRIQVAGATTFSLVTVGAAVLFFMALPAFKSDLRKAFLVICTAVTLLGLSLLEQPIMEIFNLRQYPLVSLLYPLPILLAATLFHTGDAIYVRLVGIKNVWTTVWPVLVAGVVLSVVTWVLPHQTTSETELVHDVAAIIWVWITLTPIASAIILPMAVRRLPELYKPSARYLFFSMFPIIAVCAYQYTVRIVAGPLMAGLVAYVLFSLVTVMGITLLVAGYSFNKVSRY